MLLIVTIHEAACVIILVLSVCMCVTFESLDVGRSDLHMRCISTDYGSSWHMKVIASRSRSPEPKRSKIPIPAM